MDICCRWQVCQQGVKFFWGLAAMTSELGISRKIRNQHKKLLELGTLISQINYTSI